VLAAAQKEPYVESAEVGRFVLLEDRRDHRPA
jgi:hypothetical protein